VAGKKVSPLSVRRNKVKRRLRHILGGLWQQLPQNAWIVFIALPGAAVVGFNELEKDFIELAGRINTPKSGNSVDKVV
jgi:ribonuclease P protein component